MGEWYKPESWAAGPVESGTGQDRLQGEMAPDTVESSDKQMQIPENSHSSKNNIELDSEDILKKKHLIIFLQRWKEGYFCSYSELEILAMNWWTILLTLKYFIFFEYMNIVSYLSIKTYTKKTHNIF